MANVTLTDVRKTYAGGVDAIKGINLNIGDGDVAVRVDLAHVVETDGGHRRCVLSGGCRGVVSAAAEKGVHPGTAFGYSRDVIDYIKPQCGIREFRDP